MNCVSCLRFLSLLGYESAEWREVNDEASDYLYVCTYCVVLLFANVCGTISSFCIDIHNVNMNKRFMGDKKIVVLMC